MIASPQLWRVTITAFAQHAEAFGALFDDGAVAVTIMKPPRQHHGLIEAIFDHEPDAAQITAQLTAIAETLGVGLPDCKIEPVPQEDWLQKVAAASPPRRIGNLTIHEPHDAGKIPRHLPCLQIEAATAFGTGEHPTTQMCLLLLQEQLRRKHPRRVLDLGCGSGILALAAARLARCRVLAVDNDPESVRMTRHNTRVNGLSANVRAVHSDGYESQRVWRDAPYDLIFANIFARPLMHLADDLQQHLAPGGLAILAGLLHNQAVMVQSAHAMQRLHVVRSMRMGEWTALLLNRKRHS